MSLACPGITHCENCLSPLDMNEFGMCAECIEQQEKEYKRRKEIENKMTQESVKEDLKQLQNIIQKFVNKYDEPIQLSYDNNKKVSVSIKLKV